MSMNYLTVVHCHVGRTISHIFVITAAIGRELLVYGMLGFYWYRQVSVLHVRGVFGFIRGAVAIASH